MRPEKELFIDPTDERWGVGAISLVQNPAIEKNFIALNSETPYTVALTNDEKKLLIGPALIPNKRILRVNPQTNDAFNIWFSAETVEKASELYLKRHNQHAVTYEHNHQVRDCYLTQSWIKESEVDKSLSYGYTGLPAGTWMVAMKIENDDVWKRVKDNDVKGFSIEGMFVEMAMAQMKSEKQEVNRAQAELTASLLFDKLKDSYYGKE